MFDFKGFIRRDPVSVSQENSLGISRGARPYRNGYLGGYENMKDSLSETSKVEDVGNLT